MINFKYYGKSDFIVSEAMFGTNCLFKYNLLSGNSKSFPLSLDLLNVTGLRYPGGSMTESDFDVKNPNSRPLTYTTDRPFVGVTEFLNYAKSEGHSATIVLPTAKMYAGKLDAFHDAPRTINQQYLKEVISYAEKLLTTGDSGPNSLPDTPINTFEIGNEYWGSGEMTAKEYGRVVNAVTVALEEVFDRILGSNAPHPKVVVQMGGPWDAQYKDLGLYSALNWQQRVSQSNIDIISQIVNPIAKEAITGLVEHYYYDVPNSTLLQTSQAMSYINSDLAFWSKGGFGGLDLYLTEWGIKLGNTAQYGLRGASVVIEQMQYMLELGADAAFSWPAQNGQTSLAGPSSTLPVLSPMGAAFMLMSEDLVGMTLLNGTVSLAALEVDAYSSSSKAVFFVMSRSDAPQDVALNVSALISGYTSLNGTKIGIGIGLAVDDPSAAAVLTQYTQVQLGRADNLSFHLEPFEVMKIEFELPLNRQLTGTIGADRLIGDIGDDTINGLNGDDTIIGKIGKDYLHGNAGNDIINGWDGNDTIFGDSGNDRLGGQQGNDRLIGGNGDDTLQGGIGNDTAIYTNPIGVRVNLSVTTAQNTGEGWDIITSIENLSTGNGNDRLTGNADANYIESGSGNDTVSAGDGNDTLASSYGNDLLFGGFGNDSIYGGPGEDTILGGAGKDVLFGGSADGVRDQFIFNSLLDSGKSIVNRDSIYDFESGVDDISFSGIDANLSKTGSQDFTWSGSTPAQNSVWFIVDGNSILVRADVNGDSLHDFEVLIANVRAISSSDLIL